MNSLQRRFEILLPQRFNDGQPVPDELFADTLLELRQRFNAVSSETQVTRGIWEHAGHAYRGELIRVSENQQFFRALKEKLRSRFQQIEIRITTYLIDAY